MKKLIIKILFNSMTKDLAEELIKKLLNWLVLKTETKKDDDLLKLIIEIWDNSKKETQDLEIEEINV